MLEFQIVTRTVEVAERFMAVVAAEEVSIEDWGGVWPEPEYEEYVCSFGRTHHSRKQLNRLADWMGTALIYAVKSNN